MEVNIFLDDGLDTYLKERCDETDDTWEGYVRDLILKDWRENRQEDWPFYHRMTDEATCTKLEREMRYKTSGEPTFYGYNYVYGSKACYTTMFGEMSFWTEDVDGETGKGAPTMQDKIRITIEWGDLT